MPDKKLQLKTPLKNMLLNLNGDVNRATKAEEVCVSLGRYKEHYFQRIVFTWAEIADCRLSVLSDDCTLWAGRANFAVREEDVELIATTFGIRVEKRNEGKPA